jgi:flagellar assembly protein FliH
MAVNASKAPEKFLFETSFGQDQEASLKKAIEAPPEPTYFDQDLAQARADGMAAGKEAGRQEALESVENAAAEALTAIGRHLPALEESVTAMQERQLRAAVDVSAAMVRKFLPRLAQDNGLQEIEAVVRDAMTRLRDEPRIVIRVCDALLDTVKTRVDTLAGNTGFEGKIVFLAEEGMGPSDVRVEWADGGAERDTARIWQDIDEAIRHITSTPLGSSDTTPPVPGQD